MARNAKARLSYEIEADNKASGDLKKIGSDLETIDSKNKKIASSSAATGVAFAAMAAVATAALYKMGRSAADFESQMSNVATLIKGDSTRIIAELEQAVSDTAVEFGVLHSELGTNAYKVYSAGIKDVAESQKVLAEASKLSYAAVGSVDDAMKVMIDSLKSYGHTGLEAADVAGIIHNAIRIGITDLSQFGPALSKITTLAEASGISFQSLATGVAALTSTGLETPEAVTYMRGAIWA